MKSCIKSMVIPGQFGNICLNQFNGHAPFVISFKFLRVLRYRFSLCRFMLRI